MDNNLSHHPQLEYQIFKHRRYQETVKHILDICKENGGNVKRKQVIFQLLPENHLFIL